MKTTTKKNRKGAKKGFSGYLGRRKKRKKKSRKKSKALAKKRSYLQEEKRQDRRILKDKRYSNTTWKKQSSSSSQYRFSGSLNSLTYLIIAIGFVFMGGKPLIEQITSLLRNILTYFTPSPKNPDSVGVNPDLLNEGVSYSHVADRVYTMLNDSSTTPLSYFSYISQYDLNELREINNEFGKRDYCYVIGGLWCFPVSMMTMTAYHLEEEDDVFHYNMIFELYQTAGLA